MREFPSLIGKRFGKLTVVEQLPSTHVVSADGFASATAAVSISPQAEILTAGDQRTADARSLPT